MNKNHVLSPLAAPAFSLKDSCCQPGNARCTTPTWWFRAFP